MNQRNVEALARILHETETGSNIGGECCMLCERKAAELIRIGGVLVPSTLTDENCDRVWEESSDPADVRVSVRCGPDGPIFRTLLERIAREGV